MPQPQTSQTDGPDAHTILAQPSVVQAHVQLAQVQLAQRRGSGIPPIRMVTEMPESDQWGAVDVELPRALRGGQRETVGVQLDRCIARGVPIDMNCPTDM